MDLKNKHTVASVKAIKKKNLREKHSSVRRGISITQSKLISFWLDAAADVLVAFNKLYI